MYVYLCRADYHHTHRYQQYVKVFNYFVVTESLRLVDAVKVGMGGESDHAVIAVVGVTAMQGVVLSQYNPNKCCGKCLTYNSCKQAQVVPEKFVAACNKIRPAWALTVTHLETPRKACLDAH